MSGTTGETVSDPDPEQTAPINVPGGQALLAGWASSILGGRTVYVEAMVATAPPVLLPQGAITCGKTGLISHQQITDTSGHHGANIKCGSLVASGGGQIPDGNSYATGTTNQIIGYNGIAYTDATPPTFLTAKQLAQIQASVLSQASSGGSNYYTAGNINNTTTIGTPAGNCVAYIGGNITLNGSKAMTNYCETTVVMGNVVLSGGGSYTALPASNTHIVYVFGNGGTTVNGNSTNAGIFYVANSDVTLNGAGTGTFTGSIITPNNMTMEGGGTGAFHYNGNETPPPFIPNSVVTLTQWDY